MTEADIREFLAVVPFEPFTISMTGKSKYDVLRPEDVSFSKYGSLEVVMPNGLRAILSTDHIVSLSPIAVPTVIQTKGAP